MQEFAFVDETLDINLTLSYKLSIQANLNGLSFCILDPVRNKFIALSHKNFEKDLFIDYLLNYVKEYIDSNELLNKPFKNTRIIWLSDKCTLIPDILFDENNLKKYFEFNQKLDELDEIHFKKLKYSDSYSVYTIPNLFASLFINKFGDITFYNQQIPFINTILFKHHSETKKVFVHINEDFIDIGITENGKLIFYNNFRYKTDHDLMYFTMYIYDKLNLNTDNTELIISGNRDKKSIFYLELKDFIRHIRFDKLPEDYSYSYTFNKIPEHTFTNLFNLQLCE
ncbi:MAG: DUF3822 family protein [Bacteroidales bacterium]|nr:DUF3822 family protein [Bacteroidales bacterium]